MWMYVNGSLFLAREDVREGIQVYFMDRPYGLEVSVMFKQWGTLSSFTFEDCYVYKGIR
jgi:hypothetical protein